MSSTTYVYTHLAIRKEGTGSLCFLLVGFTFGTSGVLLLLLLHLFVLDELFLLLQHLEFLLIAGIVRVDLELGFAELESI